MNNKRSMSTASLVFLAIMTALVILLQVIGGGIKFGLFSISLVLVPIVLGASVGGPLAGAWLGFIFSIAVFLTGDAAAFLAVNVPGTIITVFAKGIFAGLIAGLTYKALSKLSTYGAVFASAAICPIVNTGIFLIGCRLFFYETIAEWGAALGYESAAAYMFFGLAGLNFLVELATNLILSPVILRLLKIKKA
ncbi:MAG: ECF transporter S component [Clostridia bacterium]|nr:ECF transporter S component [Clostridia bacterium]